MASFLKRLERLLASAAERGILDAAARESLLTLAREHDREHGRLSVAAVLGWLGGGIAVLGVILLIAANWGEVPDGVKIAGFLVLLAGSHGAGLWIRWTGRPWEKTAEALHFIGAGLVLAGIGLVAQIYNLNERPPNGILIWFAAITPLAFLLRSAPVAVMSILAFLLWAHMEGSFEGSPLEMPSLFIAHLLVEIGVGTALIGFSAGLRDREPPIAKAFRACGALLLFCSFYALGFYRHFSDMETEGRWTLPAVSLGLGAVGLTAGWRRLIPGSPWLRNRLVALLALGVAVSAAAFAADGGILPRGPDLEFFNFGWHETFDLAEWAVSAAAWVLWFLLALWCIAFGAREGRKAYLNAGILGVGLGVITRFFDLMGSQAMTGTFFLVGGMVLVGTGWVLERWRRSLTARMGEKP